MTIINREAEAKLTQADILQLIDYDPISGVVTWKQRVGSERWINGWNTKFAGKPTHDFSEDATFRAGYDYHRIYINNKAYALHRIIWLYMTGKWPDRLIDHINRIKTDNRWTNLREADDYVNALNRGQQVSKSGHRGIYNQGTGYRVEMKLQGKSHYLGYFSDIASAIRARDTWLLKNRGSHAVIAARSE